MNNFKLKTFYLFLSFLILLAFFNPSVFADNEIPDIEYYEEPELPEEEYLRGRILSVEDLDPERPEIQMNEYDIVAPGDLRQEAEVLITDGEHKGKTVNITNHYSDYDMYRIFLKEGMNVILVDFSGDLSKDIYLHDIARDRSVYYLVAFFALLLVVIGGIKGFKALITLVFICVYIVKVLMPLVIQGYNPIIVSVVSAAILVIVTLLTIGGISKKSIAAILGSLTGLMFAGFLALYVGNITSLTGLSTHEAQMLFFFNDNICLRELLFAGIIIGALGAVIDVGISVASSAWEIKEANPQLSFTGLIKSALNVGRDIMATMSNTMILAYVGAAIPLLLLIMSSEMPWIRVINFEMIVTEIVRGITISMGIIIAVPATAFFAALLMTNSREKKVKEDS